MYTVLSKCWEYKINVCVVTSVLFFQNIINPVENGANLIEDNIAQLKLIMNKVRKDKQNTNPLTMKLNGTLDAAVNGGVSNFDVSTYVYMQ